MLCKTLLAGSSFVLAVIASPYPQDAISFAPRSTVTAFFGNKQGNFQPSTGANSGNGVKSDIAVVPVPGATGGQVTNPAVAVTSINNADGGSGADSYRQYNGDGTTGAGWPDRSAWESYENMFNNNKPVMFSSCNQWGVAVDSATEVTDLYNAIQSATAATKIDHRFILAVVMQESGGCVRAPTSNFGVRNPGLMQDHNGAGTCNDAGVVQNPCPTSEINQMVSEGSAGTPSGDGLAQCINESNAGDVSAFYKAARIYNSGSIDPSGNLGAGIATHCYASDIANRLTGWVMAPHACTLDG